MAALCVSNSVSYATIPQLSEEENIIEEYEGFSSAAYIDSNGKKAIGYGHTIRAYEHYSQVTAATSAVILINDIKDIESFLKQIVTVPISQGQLSALTSLVYNWGKHHFLQSQGLEYLNQALYDQASIEFFSKEHGVVNINGKFSSGLYKRRQAELELWND